MQLQRRRQRQLELCQRWLRLLHQLEGREQSAARATFWWACHQHDASSLHRQLMPAAWQRLNAASPAQAAMHVMTCHDAGCVAGDMLCKQQKTSLSVGHSLANVNATVAHSALRMRLVQGTVMSAGAHCEQRAMIS